MRESGAEVREFPADESIDRLATVLEQQARYADAEPLYREALAALNEKQEEEYDYYICPVCGYTENRGAPEKCPVCGVPGERFIRIE